MKKAFLTILVLLPLALPLACNNFVPTQVFPWQNPVPPSTFTPSFTPTVTAIPTITVTPVFTLTCPLPAPILIGSPGAGNNQYNGLTDLTTDGAGNLYVLDSVNKRVQTLTTAGAYVTQWKDLLGGVNQFVSPSNIIYSPASIKLYVLDTTATASTGIVRVFSPSGSVLPSWTVPLNSRGLAVDGAGNIYVGAVTVVIRYDATGFSPTFYYNKGVNLSPFAAIEALAVDTSGNLFVAEGSDIQKFNSSGQYVTKWGSAGTATGQFFDTAYMTTDSAGYVYVTDNPLVGMTFHGRLQKFDTNGNFVCYFQATGDEMEGLALDSVGNLYLTDEKNENILKF